jgi:GntR family transcriptional regulator / MocR family aminotransferase
MTGPPERSGFDKSARPALVAREYIVSLDATRPEEPLYARIARALAGDIARGRLKPGDRLPGARSLAAMLSVNRHTVEAAFAELEAQGWVETQPARGVFVRTSEVDVAPRPFSRGLALRSAVPSTIGFDMPSSPAAYVGHPVPPKLLNLHGGVPDTRLFPHDLFARAYRSVLRRRGDRLLDYGDGRGEERLRVALAEMLTRLRGLAASSDDVLVTRGSQQAIWLAAHTLLGPGSRIGVEAWGYPAAWEAFRATGAELVPLPIDEDGVRVDGIERALAEGGLRAVYLTPHHQYPTMPALTEQRRLRVLELAKKARFAVLEDDYAHEFQYEGRPRLPLASADRHGVVIYIGTLSKIVAAGLRVGYVVAPRPLLARMAALRTLIDRQGDNLTEAALAELFEEGIIERHARRIRRIYGERRALLAHELQQRLSGRVSFQVPAGGMAFWLEVHGTRPSEWAERARARGVLIRPGKMYSLVDRGDVPFLRMGFTALNERELARAVKIAAATF